MSKEIKRDQRVIKGQERWSGLSTVLQILHSSLGLWTKSPAFVSWKWPAAQLHGCRHCAEDSKLLRQFFSKRHVREVDATKTIDQAVLGAGCCLSMSCDQLWGERRLPGTYRTPWVGMIWCVQPWAQGGALGCWCRLCRIGAIRRQNSEIPWCLIILIRFGGYHPKASGEKYDKSEAIARKLGFAVISCCSKLQLLKFRFVLTVLILPFLPEFEASGILFEQVQSLVLSSSSPFLMFFFTPASCPR